MNNISGMNLRVANYLHLKIKNYVLRHEEMRKTIALEKWFKMFKFSEYIDYKLTNELIIRLYKDSILSKFIYDGFETDEINFINTFLNQGDYFIDIGSNIGLFSLYASSRVGKTGSVIAIEPSSITFKRLQENCILNNLTNIKTYKLGLSDKNETLELNVSANGYDAWNTFVKSKDVKFSSKELVDVKSLDNFMAEIDIDIKKIALIKIDVEGFEIKVLRGSHQLLSGSNSPVFMVEFTDANAISAGYCCHEIYKLLNSYGYVWYKYDSKHKKLIYDPMQINYPYTNLIAIKDGGKYKALTKFQIQHALDKV
jgi:FkbM family methyltransferase